MVLRYFSLSFALLMTTACAMNDATKVAEAKENAGDEDIICTRERVSGSNIPKVVCRTLKQIEQERRRTQEEMRAINSQN